MYKARGFSLFYPTIFSFWKNKQKIIITKQTKRLCIYVKNHVNLKMFFLFLLRLWSNDICTLVLVLFFLKWGIFLEEKKNENSAPCAVKEKGTSFYHSRSIGRTVCKNDKRIFCTNTNAGCIFIIKRCFCTIDSYCLLYLYLFIKL